MISKLKNYFVFITLLLFNCLPIFAKDAHDRATKEEVHEQYELLQAWMGESKNQMEQVQYCIQQIQQALHAQKIQLSDSEKSLVASELEKIQDFLGSLSSTLYLHNTIEALQRAIIINNVVIKYMLSVITNDITKISTAQLSKTINNVSFKGISSEMLGNLADKNYIALIELVDAADHIGLTWYNFTYRTLKKYHAGAIVKGSVYTAIGGLATVYLLGFIPVTKWIGFHNWHEKWIGSVPTHPNEVNYEKIPDPTLFQKMVLFQYDLSKSKLVSIESAITISLYKILESTYKTPLVWARNLGTKKLVELDQKLQGTAKTNTNREGEEKVYFDELIDCAELEALAKSIADCIKHPERYERAKTEGHRCILFYGPPQTGKTLFAKALRTLMEEELGSSIKFIDAKKYYDWGFTIEEIFYQASFESPCIIFIDEIDMYGSHRDKNAYNTSQLLTCMQGIDTSKQIFVIGATNRPEQLDPALLVDGRFGKRIEIGYPKYKQRKAYLEQQLSKRCIKLSPEYIDFIAQETEGCSYNNLKRIVTEAINLSSMETRTVTQDDFEKTLDSEIRRIQPTENVSENELNTIAMYQAGKAIARHLLQTGQQVVKVTINNVLKDVKPTAAGKTVKSTTEVIPDNEKLAGVKTVEERIKLGEVFTKSTTSHQDLLSDDAQKKECMALLAGNVALRFITGANYSQCNKHDRADAMQIIYNLISQGEKITDAMRTQALIIKDGYEQELLALFAQHKELLDRVIQALITHKTIDRYQWKELVG